MSENGIATTPMTPGHQETPESDKVMASTTVTTIPAMATEPTPFVVGLSAYSEWIELRRLKVMSVVLPVVFVVALELVQVTIAGKGLPSDGYHLFFVLITVLSIAAFGRIMFRFIDRAQQQVLRQNRELAATNAASNAMRGELSVDRIIDLTLESVLSSTGATEVTVTVFPPEGPMLDSESETYRQRAESASTSPGPPEVRNAGTRLIEIPLATTTKVVGQMRLYLPAAAKESEGLGSDTLHNIGHKLACAIQLAQTVADLERRNKEGHAFHDVLLQISNQSPPAEILGSVVRHARDLLDSKDAVLCLSEDASRSLRLEGTRVSDNGPVTSEPHLVQDVHASHPVCPTRSTSELTVALTVPLRSPTGTLGDLWVARRSDVPFSARDHDFLGALCGLASIALTSAQARESERQAAILAERERIAREMHDSLAQVLGVTHLRLRALDSHVEVTDNSEVAVELAELADICEEAYSDVREAILGLRESSRTGRGLLDSLRAFLAKYSQQCGIETSCVSELDHDLALSPRSEVQLIRVIQEALTNVRKHSGAKRATVRISESDSTTTLVVEDDGDGFDQGDSPFDRDGFGLFTMRERMELLNGSLTIESSPGHGTRVIAVVPELSHPKPVPVEVKSGNTQSDPHPARGRSAAFSGGYRSSDRWAG
jgi:signal transduction histidine kinase